MRNKFDEQLALLNTELIQMGALCEEAISKAAKALEAGDPALAETVKPLEGEIENVRKSMLLNSHYNFKSRSIRICLRCM